MRAAVTPLTSQRRPIRDPLATPLPLESLPLGRWLCVPAFRRVCPLTIALLATLRCVRDVRMNHSLAYATTSSLSGATHDSRFGGENGLTMRFANGSDRQPRYPWQLAAAFRTGGFASPPHDGFALKVRRVNRSVSPDATVSRCRQCISAATPFSLPRVLRAIYLGAVSIRIARRVRHSSEGCLHQCCGNG